MVAVKLLYIMSGSISFENTLSIYKSIRIAIDVVGCKIKDINESEATESKNSLSNSSHYNSID